MDRPSVLPGLFDAFNLLSQVAVDRTTDGCLLPRTTVRTLRQVFAEYLSLSASK